MDYEDDEPEYNEVRTGTGKMLALFIGLVMVCGIFFGLGYSMGKSAAPHSGSMVPEAAAATTAPDASKPSPALPADTAPACPQGQDCSAAPAGSTSDQMTFYKSVEQKDANAQLTPPAAPAEREVAPAPAPAKPKPAAASVIPSTEPGYSVQVAAVTKPQDADALVDALRQKQYPAFVTTSANDKLLHVQVGPFTAMKDAEAMKVRLAADGYNPILKK